MEVPAILFNHECNVYVRHDVLRGFGNTSLSGFYFHLVVRERTTVYYFCGDNYDCVHHYNLDGERHVCGRFVVKVEDISRCQTRAMHVIAAMLQNLNVCETVQPEMVWKIYSKAHFMARHMENVPDVKIPIMVDILKMFRQPMPNPFVASDMSQYWYGSGEHVEEEEEEEEQAAAPAANERQCRPVPAARSSVAGLEKVKLKPKETCTICLGGLIKATRLPCGHVFHERCIVKWLKRNHVCPLCRFELPAAAAN